MTEPTPESAPDSAGAGDSPGAETARHPDAAARYADRYGRAPRTRRWPVLVLGVLVVVAGIGVGYLGWQQYGPDEIQTEQLGYIVLDDSTIEVRIKLTRADPEKPVVCFVRAMDADIAEVGRREILIEGSEHGTVEFTTMVRTSERPASGAVYGCTESVPEYLRSR